MVVQFALIWWLTSITGSAVALATASIVGIIPTILFSPLAGVLVDRWPRRKVLIWADGAIGLTALALAILVQHGLLQPWQVYLAIFVRSILGAFHWPAMQASISLMAPRESLSHIKGLDSALYGILRITTPPLGALLLNLWPLSLVLVIDLVTAALAIATVIWAHIPQPPKTGSGTPGVMGELIAGVHYLFSSRGLRRVLLLAALVNLLAVPFFTLLPIWIRRYYQGGAVEYGWIEAVSGAGILAGGVLLSLWGGFRQRIFTSMWALVGMSIGCVMAGLVDSHQFVLAVAAVGVVSMMQTLVQGPMLAVLQDVVPPGLQGRVLTLLDSTSSLMAPLGLALAGVLSDAYYPQMWFLVCAGGFAVLAVAAMTSRPVRRIELDMRDDGG